nr:MAG TPA: hypothetical protein [Caudoviricetes sp.]
MREKCRVERPLSPGGKPPKRILRESGRVSLKRAAGFLLFLTRRKGSVRPLKRSRETARTLRL